MVNASKTAARAAPCHQNTGDRIKAALEEIATQHLSAEMNHGEWGGADFEYAYDKMIEVARAALNAAGGK